MKASNKLAFSLIEILIQTVSITNNPDSLKFYFRINICKLDMFEVISD